MSTMDESEILRQVKTLAEIRRTPEAVRRTQDHVRAALAEAMQIDQAASQPHPKGRVVHLWNLIGGTKMRRRFLLAASAAAILLLVLNPPVGSSRSGIAWADVVQQIHSVKTMVFEITDETAVDGTHFSLTEKRKHFLKDPGMSRWERTGTATTQPKARSTTQSSPWMPAPFILIQVFKPMEYQAYYLYPADKRANVNRVCYSSPSPCRHDQAEENWCRLARITANQTQSLGHRNIDGIPSVGFSAPAQAFAPELSRLGMEGEVRVWAAQKTAIPVRVEMDIHNKGSRTTYRSTVRNIEWNVPLADTLFAPPDLQGWNVTESRTATEKFSKTHLRRGVRLQVRPSKGSPILTECDIEKFTDGRTILTTERDKTTRMTLVNMALTKTGWDKLKAYGRSHVGGTVIIDFAGQVQDTFHITEHGFGPGLALNITKLGKTPRQFETEFLTSGK